MDLPDLELGEHRYPQGARLGRHAHRRPFVCFLVHGRYEERVGRRLVRYRPATAVLHGPGLSHADDISAGGCLFGVRLGPSYARRLGAEADPVVVGEAGGTLSWLFARARDEWRRAEPCADLAIEGLLLEAIAVWRRRSSPDVRPPWMGRVEEALRAGLQRPVRLADLADEVGVDAPLMARTFRRLQGQSLSAYVRRLRVEEACRRIAAGEEALTDVAAACGFADQSHMTRTFRRVMATTPAAFRALLRPRG